jgi:uncharacterized cupredoxin-like copper-binding protein
MRSYHFAATLAATLLTSEVAPRPAHARPAVTPGASPPVVTAEATDYRLSLPTTLPAGPTTFRLVNRGREPHQLLLVRLAPGHSAADYANALKKGGPPPAWAREAGGPNGVDPGATSLATTVPLETGRYAAVCVIPGPDGTPHLFKGMYRDLVVTPGVRAVAHEAAPADTVTLFDYGFRTSRTPAAGAARVLVRNVGKQAHEMEIARLLPGKTVADLAAWAEKMAGPPPARFVGGVSPIAPGAANDLTLALTPGRYALLCFVPDAADGKPHVAHGMAHELEVR